MGPTLPIGDRSAERDRHRSCQSHERGEPCPTVGRPGPQRAGSSRRQSASSRDSRLRNADHLRSQSPLAGELEGAAWRGRHSTEPATPCVEPARRSLPPWRPPHAPKAGPRVNRAHHLIAPYGTTGVLPTSVLEHWTPEARPRRERLACPPVAGYRVIRLWISQNLGWSRELDPSLLKDRHQPLAEGLELLLRVPDLTDPEAATGRERNMERETVGRPLA